MLQFSIDAEVFRSLFAGSPMMNPPKALIVLHHVRIDLVGRTLVLSMTDLVSYYTASTNKVKFEENGSFLLPIAALRRLPRSGMVSVSFDGSKVGLTDNIITSWSYNTLSVEDFPHIPIPTPDTTTALDVPSLKWAMEEAGKICDPLCITSSLRQISVKDGVVETTDGELFMRYITPSSVSFTLPARSLKAFMSALDVDELEIGTDETLTSLVSSKRVVSFTTFDTPFPNLSPQFNLSVVSNLDEIIVSPVDLINAIRAVHVDINSVITISGTEMNVEAITLHCSDLPTGYSGNADFHCKTTAGKFTLSVNSGRLIRMLSAVADESEVSLMVGSSSVSYKTPKAQSMLLRRV